MSDTNPVSSAVAGAVAKAEDAVNGALNAAKQAVASPAGQAVVTQAGQYADAAVDAAAQVAIQSICAKHGLPAEQVSAVVHAVASHYGLSASALFAKLTGK